MLRTRGHARTRAPATARGFVDASWLFLAAGLAATAALVLIPAAESLELARFQRDTALTWEHERLDRLARHRAYLESIQNREPATVRQLRILQLNQLPTGLTPIGNEPSALDTGGLVSASIFEKLEPEPLPRPERPAHLEARSRLAAWAVGDRSRLWLAGAAGLCLLIGLLPTGRPSRKASQSATSESPGVAGATVTA